jgi:transcriptional regulator of arginine metabolism
MKAQRHAAILALVRRHRVASQEQLRTLLGQDGVEVTQATLSRDIRELGLVKVADPAGGAHYAPPIPTDAPPPPLAPLVHSLLLSMEGVESLLVIRTPPGSANALGSVLDRQVWPEIVGTIAGDDTLLVITRNATARGRVATRLEELGGTGA